MRKWIAIAPVTLAVLAAGCGETTTQKASTGAAGGAVAGAVVGGPIGALVGAGIGGAGGAYRDEIAPEADQAVSQAFNRAERELDGEPTGTTGAAIEPARPGQATHRQSDLTNQEVREAQTALKDMGLYDGKVDGIYGRRSIGAVKEFQAKQDIRRTGALDDRTKREIQMAAKDGAREGAQTTAGADRLADPKAPAAAQSEQTGGSEQAGATGAAIQPSEGTQEGAATTGADPSADTTEPASAQSGQADGTEQRGATGAAIEASGDAQNAARLSKEQVRDAQTALKEMGFYNGTVDGLMGPRTAEAVKKFQAKHDLQRTGTLDEQTRQQLQAAAAQGGATPPAQPGGAEQPSPWQEPPARARPSSE